MNDSLLFNFNVLMIGDTSVFRGATVDSNSLVEIVPVNFLLASHTQIKPLLNSNNFNYDLITYIVLVLIGVASIIWYVVPDRFLNIFTLKSIKRVQREGDSSSSTPGAFIVGAFWIIFVISLSFFIFLILNNFFTNKISLLSDYQVIINILFAISVLFIYRFAIIYFSAIIFQTQKLRKQQVIVDRNIQLITGILLLPVILLMLYTNGVVLVYFVVGFIALLQLYRLSQIVIIGKSSTVFSLLHIILYLCTLEIVPILVLYQLINSSSGT